MDLMAFLKQYSLTDKGQQALTRIATQKQWIVDHFQLDSDGDIKVLCEAFRELKACRNCDGNSCRKTYGQFYCINQIERCRGEYALRRGYCKTFAPLTREIILNQWQTVFSGDDDAIMDGGKRRHADHEA